MPRYLPIPGASPSDSATSAKRRKKQDELRADPAAAGRLRRARDIASGRISSVDRETDMQDLLRNNLRFARERLNSLTPAGNSTMPDVSGPQAPPKSQPAPSSADKLQRVTRVLSRHVEGDNPVQPDEASRFASTIGPRAITDRPLPQTAGGIRDEALGIARNTRSLRNNRRALDIASRASQTVTAGRDTAELEGRNQRVADLPPGQTIQQSLVGDQVAAANAQMQQQQQAQLAAQQQADAAARQNEIGNLRALIRNPVFDQLPPVEQHRPQLAPVLADAERVGNAPVPTPASRLAQRITDGVQLPPEPQTSRQQIDANLAARTPERTAALQADVASAEASARGGATQPQPVSNEDRLADSEVALNLSKAGFNVQALPKEHRTPYAETVNQPISQASKELVGWFVNEAKRLHDQQYAAGVAESPWDQLSAEEKKATAKELAVKFRWDPAS